MSIPGGTLLTTINISGISKPPGQLGRDRRALKILAVRPHHQDQHVRNGDRQQRLFVDARMRVDEQIIEPQISRPAAESRR